MLQESKMKIDQKGNKRWYNQNGQYHCLNGPAIQWNDGGKYWYQNGKLHRINGPAVEYPNGTKKWYQNDQLHHINGPAIEYADGTKEYWINAIKFKSYAHWALYCIQNNLWD